MSQPTVACIMLVNGREAMVMRAIKSFRGQTYAKKRLLIWDTGELNDDFDNDRDGDGAIVHVPAEAYREITVGALRNEANGFWTEYPILIHWDSDDYSHPNRIAEQVALLQLSKKQCVGYLDMLFWNQTEGHFCGAWLYSNPAKNYCLGTSLCYWRSVWESRLFPDLPKKKGGTGEDVEWLRVVDSLGVTSLAIGEANPLGAIYDYEARMIASIHGDNTQYYGADLLGASTSWKRVPEWDQYCREKMA